MLSYKGEEKSCVRTGDALSIKGPASLHQEVAVGGDGGGSIVDNFSPEDFGALWIGIHIPMYLPTYHMVNRTTVVLHM